MVQVKAPSSADDEFVKLVGQFGRWQFILFSSIILVKVASGWVQMAILFLTPTMTFYCAEFSDNSTIVVQNSTCYASCARYEYDVSPFENTIISEWGLVCSRAWLASLTQTVLMLGVLVGSTLFGFLSDRFGRKNSFLFSVTAMLALEFGLPFATSYTVFTTLRFLLGMATAGTMVISFVIVMETVGPKYREVAGCMFQIPFVIGQMLVPAFAYYLREWNTYLLALAVPQLLYLGYFFVITESPRWLLSVGRIDEATEIVNKIASINNLSASNVKEALTKLSAVLKARADEPKANYSDLVKPGLVKWTVCLCLAWAICGLTFFGVNQYISQTSPDPFISVAAAGAIQIPGDLASIYLIRRFGRRWTVAASFCLCGLCIIALGVVPKIFSITLTLGTLGVVFAGITATSIYVYTSELYPTVVRNMGLGIASTAMRIGSMAAPFVSNLNSSIPWLPTALMGVGAFVSGLIILLLPETKGRALKDSLEELNDS